MVLLYTEQNFAAHARSFEAYPKNKLQPTISVIPFSNNQIITAIRVRRLLGLAAAIHAMSNETMEAIIKISPIYSFQCFDIVDCRDRQSQI